MTLTAGKWFFEPFASGKKTYFTVVKKPELKDVSSGATDHASAERRGGFVGLVARSAGKTNVAPQPLP